MKFCKKCKVYVAGTREKCPLCENIISDINDIKSEDKFPKIKPKKNWKKIIWRIFLFVTIIIVLLSMGINYELPTSTNWSKYVAFGIFSLWIILYIGLNKNRNLLKCIFYETIVVTVLALIWDYFTGFNRWSIDFVIPIILSVVIFSTWLLVKILRIDAEEHIVYLVTLSILGMIPVLLLFLGVLNIKLPSMICGFINIVIFLFVLLFEGRKLWIEFTKRLHI